MSWSTKHFSTVYSAIVRIDNGPNTPTTYLMDARWASRHEARGHIERRFPDIHNNPDNAELRMDALVVAGRTSCTMQPSKKGLVVPVERLRRDWTKVDTAIVQSDGKVTGWIAPAYDTGGMLPSGMTTVRNVSGHPIKVSTLA